MSAFPPSISGLDQPSSRGAKPRRRLLRWLKWLCLALAIVIAAYMLVMHGFIGRKIAERSLSKTLGGVVTLDEVDISPSGRVVTRGLTVRVPGVAGPAGEVLTIARVEALTTLPSLVSGSPVFRSVTVDSLTARISQHVKTGKVNLAGLERSSAAQGGSPISSKLAAQLPQIALRGSTIELGEHDDAAADGIAPFTVLKSLGVSGTIEKLEEGGASVISFRQTQDASASSTATEPSNSGKSGANPADASNFIARGRIDSTGVSLIVTGIDFSALSPTQTPKAARELFQESMLEGSVPEAELVYSFDGTWRSRISLAGVSMNLPVETTQVEEPVVDDLYAPKSGNSGAPPTATPAQVKRRLRLLNTSGTVDLSDAGVQAQLSGYIEELPYSVTLQTSGPSVNNAWTVTMRTDNFQLERNPEILRFVPQVVQERLADFGNPTGIVDAFVTLSRAEVLDKQSPPQVRVKGTLNLRDVRATFHKFPYPWQKLRGVVDFDEQRVVFRNITGEAAGGGTVVATVTIEPPTDDAGVEVQVQVKDLPADDRVAKAMRARGQERVLLELLDAQGYESLRPAMLASGVAEPRALGGTLDVQVYVKREVGPESIWTDRVEISMDDVMLMPRELGYPLLAKHLTIVQEDTTATAKGTLIAPTGGEVTIDTTIDVQALALPDAPFRPAIKAKFSKLHIDALLLAAISRRTDNVSQQIAEAVTGLQATGTISGEVSSDGDQTRAMVRVLGEVAPMAPGGEQDNLARLEQVRTTVEVDPAFVQVGVKAKVPGSTSLLDDIDVQFNLPTGEQDNVRVTARSMNLQTPVGRFLRPFAPVAAARCDEVQAKLSPKGLANVLATVLLEPRESTKQTSASITIVPTSEVQLSSGGSKFVIGVKEGNLGIEARTDGSASLTFANIQATVNQAAAGSDASATPAQVSVSGGLLLARANGDVSPKAELNRASLMGDTDIEQRLRDQGCALVVATDVAVAGSFSRAILSVLGEAALLDDIESTQADGLLDARVLLGSDLLLDENQDTRSDQFFARLEPKSLSLGYRGERLTFQEISGLIVLEGETGGRVVNLAVREPGKAQATANGAWGTSLARDRMRAAKAGPHQSGTLPLPLPVATNEIDVTIALEATGLNTHARSLLPRDVAATLDDLEITTSKLVLLPNLSLRGTLDGESELQTFAASGTVQLNGASAKLGAQIDDAVGTCEFRYARVSPNEPGQFSVEGQLVGLRVLGVGLTDGRVALRSTPRGGIVAEQFSAQVHGGRVTGSLSLAPPIATVLMPGERAPGRWFDLSLEASNVRFAPLVQEGRALRGAQAKPVEADLAPDGSRGVLSGSLTLAGKSDDAQERRGRGTLNVRGGTVVSLPVVLPLLRVSNLQLPTSDVLDYALADFYLQGSSVTLEQLSISSRAVGLYGFGTVSWPAFDLDLRFRAANRSRIPVLTAIIEGVRDELVSTTVRGTLDNPQVSLRPLEGTRAVLRDLAGGSATEQERRMQTIEKSVSPEERRARPGEEELIDPRE